MAELRIKDRESRRKFLVNAGKAAGAVLLTSMSGTVTGLLFATKEPKGEGPWYGIGIDIDKCIGCGNCVKACKIENDVPKEPFFFMTWVEQYTIKNDGTIVVESPNGGHDGFTQSVAEDDIFKSFYVPKMCNHCYNSPCERVCPVGATYMSPEGVVLVDETYCIGCRYCIQACPYGCRFLHPTKKIADKCTLCYHRITKGLLPACVQNCPTGARLFGDLRDEESELVQFIKENHVHVLKPHLNTGSKLFYNGLNKEVR